MYGVENFDRLYTEGFYTGYVEAYEKTYTETFYKLQFEDIKAIQSGEILVSEDYKIGQGMGKAEGTLKGTKDAEISVAMGLANDYNKMLPSQGKVIEDYKLYLDNAEFEDGFLDGYQEGYRVAFMANYRQVSLIKAKAREEYNLFMQGGKITSEDNNVTINFDPGTVYLDNYVEVKEVPATDKVVKQGKLRVSKFYEVEVNDGEGVNLHKPIKVEFTYMGPDNVGVYNADSGEYLNTYVEGDTVYTYIQPSKWKGDTYVVYIDNDKPLTS